MKVLHTVHVNGENESRQTILVAEHGDLFKLYCDVNQVDEGDREEVRAGVTVYPLGIFIIDPGYIESYVVLEVHAVS